MTLTDAPHFISPGGGVGERPFAGHSCVRLRGGAARLNGAKGGRPKKRKP